MRRMEILLGCSKVTIARKIAYLAEQAQIAHEAFLANPENHTTYALMDELETFIHARYKQVSVPVVIRSKNRTILAFGVARTPSKLPLGGAGQGPLPPGGVPWRRDDRPRVVPAVLEQAGRAMKPGAKLATDGASSYPKWIERSLPGVIHVIGHSPDEKSLARAKKRADGEPREFDPLQPINVTFATMRNDLARLGRKTWTTTKTMRGLEQHLWIYVAWRNGYKLQ